jgi:hypothetical protein
MIALPHELLSFPLLDQPIWLADAFSLQFGFRAWLFYLLFHYCTPLNLPSIAFPISVFRTLSCLTIYDCTGNYAGNICNRSRLRWIGESMWHLFVSFSLALLCLVPPLYLC